MTRREAEGDKAGSRGLVSERGTMAGPARDATLHSPTARPVTKVQRGGEEERKEGGRGARSFSQQVVFAILKLLLGKEESLIRLFREKEESETSRHGGAGGVPGWFGGTQNQHPMGGTIQPMTPLCERGQNSSG